MLTDLDELERLERAALDAPWRSGHNDAPEPPYLVMEDANSSAVCYVRFAHDSRFIASLRNAAPDLIRQARAAQEMRAVIAHILAVDDAALKEFAANGFGMDSPCTEMMRAVLAKYPETQ